MMISMPIPITAILIGKIPGINPAILLTAGIKQQALQLAELQGLLFYKTLFSAIGFVGGYLDFAHNGAFGIAVVAQPAHGQAG